MLFGNAAKARAEGMRAHLAGQAASCNPHPERLMAHRYWTYGWHDARRLANDLANAEQRTNHLRRQLETLI